MYVQKLSTSCSGLGVRNWLIYHRHYSNPTIDSGTSYDQNMNEINYDLHYRTDRSILDLGQPYICT